MYLNASKFDKIYNIFKLECISSNFGKFPTYYNISFLPSKNFKNGALPSNLHHCSCSILESSNPTQTQNLSSASLVKSHLKKPLLSSSQRNTASEIRLS